MVGIDELKESGNDSIIASLKEDIDKLNALRTYSRDEAPKDISLGEFMRERHGFAIDEKTGAPNAFFESIGIDPSKDNLAQLANLSDFDGRRWIVPEIIREALRQGLSTSLWADLIASEDNVRGMEVVTPSIEVSNGFPADVPQQGTIPFGEVNLTDKKVKLYKIGTGIKMSYEVVAFSSINMIALYLQDSSVNLMNFRINKKMIDVLLNGDQADSSLAPATVGVLATANKITYRDILKAWIKMGMLERTPDTMLAGEDVTEDVLMLSEFKDKKDGTTEKMLDVKTPIPNMQNFYSYGLIPSTDLILMDSKSALAKFNAQALMIESDKNIQNQIYNTVATVITGFGNIGRDARLVIRNNAVLGANGAANGYPTWMNASAFHQRA